ncbi:hypothetical protein [Afifella aestuarii]|uniref:hypothetical protein n=1 Tax=Afifella aestuarii TaxID=1909496 RepID=UPI0013E2D0E0|nr:hypothetical protein [Afifella aestuarii]
MALLAKKPWRIGNNPALGTPQMVSFRANFVLREANVLSKTAEIRGFFGCETITFHYPAIWSETSPATDSVLIEWNEVDRYFQTHRSRSSPASNTAEYEKF